MKSSEEIFQEMKELWTTFEENHERFVSKKVKAAGVRSRKAINELKKLASTYRKQCLAESKEL